MKVGVMLPQAAEDGAGTWSEIADLARRAEDAGIDSLWLSDHFFYRAPDAGVGAEVGFHEPWTLLSALAAVTTRIELGTLVLATGFRPAGMLAKMAVTADEVASGRIILGIGCGWHEPEYEAFGVPFDHRVGRFEDAIRIIAGLVGGERVSVEGRYESVRGAVILPPPRRRVPILVAAKSPRMLSLTARHADAWQTAWFGLPDERFRERHRGLLAACAAEGRDPASLEVTVGVTASAGEPVSPAALPLDPATLVNAFEAWEAAGVDHLQVGVEPSTAETFAIVAEALGRYRSG